MTNEDDVVEILDNAEGSFANEILLSSSYEELEDGETGEDNSDGEEMVVVVRIEDTDGNTKSSSGVGNSVKAALSAAGGSSHALVLEMIDCWKERRMLRLERDAAKIGSETRSGDVGEVKEVHEASDARALELGNALV
jgi:hypothetical protein